MIVLSLLACGVSGPAATEPTAAVPDSPTQVQPDPAADLPGVDTEVVGDVSVPDALGTSRARRRMRVSQLADSIEVATGRRWMNGDVDQFERLSGSLGVPDYLDRVGEDLEAGLLFQKSIDDAASEVCHSLVDDEFAGTSDRLLGDLTGEDDWTTDPAGMDAAMSAALLRFHSRDLPPDSPELDGWRFLFEGTLTVTGDDHRAAWRAVCIGLIVHPDFYHY